MEDKHITAMVAIDISGAFNKVNHDIPLKYITL